MGKHSAFEGRKREEGRGKKEEGRRKKLDVTFGSIPYFQFFVINEEVIMNN
ncbi:hypothetical protein [Okeania sp.]|uniref:hypothetical protein n=1 Tax=Okeania sp. TaxID=3100323 RepID=UPI002B4B960C|nr:hypothetical protein [Okeania sp.]MEB3340098.1 hypothetical protein [Okeania sp.]